MTKEELASMFDHTFLKAYASRDDFIKLCDEAKDIGAAMVAINSEPVKLCKELLTKQAIDDGADEIDYVINIGKAKMHDWDYIEKEMQSIVQLCHQNNRICKVIFENCYLTKDEIKHIAFIAKQVKPDYIKTSTGFGTSGATVEDVRLMKETVGDEVKVKAAGGIRDWKTCRAMIEVGASRIGTSSSLKILEEFEEDNHKL